jgi:hypothetical protein
MTLEGQPVEERPCGLDEIQATERHEANPYQSPAACVPIRCRRSIVIHDISSDDWVNDTTAARHGLGKYELKRCGPFQPGHSSRKVDRGDPHTRKGNAEQHFEQQDPMNRCGCQ